MTKYYMGHAYDESLTDWLNRPGNLTPVGTVATGAVEVKPHNPIHLTGREATAVCGIRAAEELAHKTATDAGWHENPREFGTMIALIHSEISEAMEAHRKDRMDDKLPHRKGAEVELADAIIRILDLAAREGFDVAGALIEKNRFNRDRADHKREARQAPGGKRY